MQIPTDKKIIIDETRTLICIIYIRWLWKDVTNIKEEKNAREPNRNIMYEKYNIEISGTIDEGVD